MTLIITKNVIDHPNTKKNQITKRTKIQIKFKMLHKLTPRICHVLLLSYVDHMCPFDDTTLYS